MRTDPRNTVDDRYFLRARLLDAMVGDWDRHSGQWRWGDADGRGLDPLARDPRGSRLGIQPDRWHGRHVEHAGCSRGTSASPIAFLRRPAWSSRSTTGCSTGWSGSQFLDVVSEVRSQLTDSVLAAAVEALPAPYLALERDWLLSGLKARRDQLGAYGEAFYLAVANTVHVRGFQQTEDYVEFQRVSKERIRVTVRTGGATGPLRFDRVLDGRETRTVKVFVDLTVDHVIGNQGLPFKVEILPPDL